MVRGDFGNLSNLETKFPELLQRFGVTPGVVHGIVGMFGDAIFLSLSRFGRVFDQAGIKIPDATAGKSKWVSAKKTMEVVIDELPVERNVVRYKNGPYFGVLFQPSREGFHHRFRVVKAKMLLTRKSADGKRLRHEPIRNRSGLPVEGLVQLLVKQDCAKADHRELSRYRPIRFNIYYD
jgi:hypothetical protein